MIDETVLDAAKAYVQEYFAGDASGHDAAHTMRVYQLALRLARAEGAEQGIVGLAALLHDVDDPKLSPKTAEVLGNARVFLVTHDVSQVETRAVLTAIRECSFSKNRGSYPTSIESACVRDADRLDALGAIGIARTFAYGGSRGRALYDPTGADDQTSIQHFYDKLLLLADMMCTDTGLRMARHRDRVLREFLKEFVDEWRGAC